MKIHICTKENGNIYPAPYTVVDCIPGRCVFNQDLGINHPVAVYNISTKRVIDSFISLHDLILDSDKESKKMEDNLIKAEIEMMEAMMAHIDDCYSILMSLQPFEISMKEEKMRKKQRFPTQWLAAYKNPAYKEFEAQIADYRDSFSDIVIDIKHKAGRLGFITCENTKENQIVYGFFRRAHAGIRVNIVNIRNNRIVLFHDDLRYHLLNFYIVGEYLKEAIFKSIKHFHNLEPQIKRKDHEDSKYLDVLQTIASNPILFINAFSSLPPTYLCKFESKENNKCLKINTSRVHDSVSWKDNVKCAATFFADGYSRAHEIP